MCIYMQCNNDLVCPACLQEFAKQLQREEYEAKKRRQASQQQQQQQQLQQEPEDDAVSIMYNVGYTCMCFGQCSKLSILG